MNRLSVLLVALLLGASVATLTGRPARADDKPAAKGGLEVSAAPKKAEVALGDEIELDVTVKNGGEALDLPELSFDARSVSFEISYEGGKQAWDVQFHVNETTSSLDIDPLTSLSRTKLEKDKSWTKTFTIPAIAAGTYAITPVYGGTSEAKSLAGVGDPLRLVKLRGPALTVKVLPGAAGETDLVGKVATTHGTMTFAFFPKDALGSALNFVRIARSGFYDGKSIHRIDEGLGVVQGGATKADGSGHFPWCIPLEVGLKHRPLMVGMARSNDPNSAGSQFYVCTAPQTAQLDGRYAVWAQVVKGKDVVQTLASVRTKGAASGAMGPSQQPATDVKIESVKIQPAPKS